MVTVIDKSGDSQGWWKAVQVEDGSRKGPHGGVAKSLRVGFVPKEFVQVGTAPPHLAENRVQARGQNSE